MKFTALVTFFLLAPPTAVSSNDDDSFDLENYCRTAQKIIATTELDAKIQRPRTFQEFVQSKPEPYNDSQQELLVSQFVGNPPSAPDLQTVLCKMKEAGSIRKYLGVLKAGRNKSCADVNRAVVESVVAQIQQEESHGDDSPSFVPPTIVYDNDWKCMTGSQWTHNSPAVTAYLDDAGTLHLVGKSLTSLPWWFPIFIAPIAPFIGVHYCEVISAESIRSILLGATVPPTCGPPPTQPLSYVFNAWDCPMKSSSGDEL